MTTQSSHDLILAQAYYGPMLVYSNDQVIGLSLRNSGSFQESKIKDVVDFLSKNFNFSASLFVDIGANIGTHLVYSLKTGLFDSAIGIEADARNFRLLTANVVINDLSSKVELIHCALSDTVEDLELELCPLNFGDHRIRVAEVENKISFSEAQRQVVKVASTTFNHVVENKPIDWQKTLIWVDTQGHEGHIFKGGEDTFRHKSSYLVTEFWPYGLERAGGRAGYFDFLSKCRHIYDINSSDWTEGKTVSLDELNAMYEDMLSKTTEDYYPHTDLLCIT